MRTCETRCAAYLLLLWLVGRASPLHKTMVSCKRHQIWWFSRWRLHRRNSGPTDHQLFRRSSSRADPMGEWRETFLKISIAYLPFTTTITTNTTTNTITTHTHTLYIHTHKQRNCDIQRHWFGQSTSPEGSTPSTGQVEPAAWRQCYLLASSLLQWFKVEQSNLIDWNVRQVILPVHMSVNIHPAWQPSRALVELY